MNPDQYTEEQKKDIEIKKDKKYYDKVVEVGEQTFGKGVKPVFTPRYKQKSTED